jgi:hypothetical protein
MQEVIKKELTTQQRKLTAMELDIVFSKIINIFSNTENSEEKRIVHKIIKDIIDYCEDIDLDNSDHERIDLDTSNHKHVDLDGSNADYANSDDPNAEDIAVINNLIEANHSPDYNVDADYNACANHADNSNNKKEKEKYKYKTFNDFIFLTSYFYVTTSEGKREELLSILKEDLSEFKKIKMKWNIKKIEEELKYEKVLTPPFLKYLISAKGLSFQIFFQKELIAQLLEDIPHGIKEHSVGKYFCILFLIIIFLLEIFIVPCFSLCLIACKFFKVIYMFFKNLCQGIKNKTCKALKRIKTKNIIN